MTVRARSGAISSISATLCYPTAKIIEKKNLKYAPKPYQMIATDGLARKRDVIVKTPTSTGKGQIIEYATEVLAAMKAGGKGTAVIIEPLRSLLKEFIDRYGAIATYVDSSHKDDALLASIRDGKYQMVFVTAESATQGAFLNKVLMDHRFRKNATCLIFDEAHTLDQWGRDFRPKFNLLGEVRKHLDVPVMVMSATLTAEAQKACEVTLRLTDPLLIDLGSDRPNLFINVQPMRYSSNGLLDLLVVLPELWTSRQEPETQAWREACFPTTLIYVNNKELATSMHGYLKPWFERAGFGDAIDVYHADMSDEHLRTVRKRMDTRKTLLVICTDAFGMGADCKEVTRVYHWKVFGSVSAFWQRIGRAGRDFADQAECTLLVEPTFLDSEEKASLSATGQLPVLMDLEEGVNEAATFPSLAKEAAAIRAANKGNVARQMADDELVAFAKHGLKRDACLRRLILDNLGRPSADVPYGTPEHSEMFTGSRSTEGQSASLCCSSCCPDFLPDAPDEFLPVKESAPLLPGVQATQKILRARLEEWRVEQWHGSWEALKRPGRLGIDAFMSLLDVDAIVSNIKTIAHNFEQGDSQLRSFIGTRYKSDVVPAAEQVVKDVLDEQTNEREKVKAAADAVRRQRAEETRQRQEAKRDARSQREAEARGRAAESSNTRTSTCSACTTINRHHAAAQLQAVG
ncbi:hypothetical protein CF326_g8497 [Tilletia indica]|nr:hypothetical protein CF326_g8497 [Tilletia indica]